MLVLAIVLFALVALAAAGWAWEGRRRVVAPRGEVVAAALQGLPGLPVRFFDGEGPWPQADIYVVAPRTADDVRAIRLGADGGNAEGLLVVLEREGPEEREAAALLPLIAAQWDGRGEVVFSSVEGLRALLEVMP